MNIRLKDVQEFNKLLIISGFSQRSFAKEINISSPYMNQIANGERSPSPKVAKKICDGLNVGFDEIFFIESANKSKQTKSA